MKRFGLAAIGIGMALSLAGCGAAKDIATFTSSDALNAGSMATAAGKNGDTGAASRGTCYNAFGNVATGVAATPNNSAGIFTGVEAGIEVQAAIQKPECQAIAGQVLLWGLRHAPGGNLLP